MSLDFNFSLISSLFCYSQDKEGKDVEIYVPSELSEDKLFSQGIHSGINFDKFEKIPVSLFILNKFKA